jgi:hypothetical protein
MPCAPTEGIGFNRKLLYPEHFGKLALTKILGIILLILIGGFLA